MEALEELRQYFSENSLWNDIFDIIRLIEGNGTHHICKFENDKIITTKEVCYNFWSRCTHCENCVSKQAAKAGKQLVKLEYVNEKYYFVIAKPIKFENKQYIVEFLSNITTKLATGVDNSNQSNFVAGLINQLSMVSSRDLFTGLYNKNYLKSQIENKLEKQENKIYLALIDIDDFKKVNDNFGHIFGDMVIKHISCLFEKLVPLDIGFASRFGGDEFAILFNEKKLLHIKNIMHKLQEEFTSYDYIYNNAIQHFTFSYGIAEVSGVSNSDEALKLADSELYLAKAKKPIFRVNK